MVLRMLDPGTLAAGGAIAKLAFDEFVKSSAGEAAKELIQTLRDRIKAKFQGNKRATAALAEVEQNASEAALAKVGKYLDLEMDEEQGFATEVRQMAQQIINIQSQTTTQIERQYNHQGSGDQINIERVDKIDRLGGRS
jgi:hypothetical protein